MTVNDHFAAVSLGVDLDAALALAVLAGVVAQVAEHLRQAHRIGLDVDRLRRQVDHQLVLEVQGHRPAGLDSVMDDRRQLHPLLAQLEIVAGDAAHVEQIVDQPHQAAQLPLHGVARLFLQLRAGVGALHDLERVAQRCERPAQLVRESGEELVLAPIRFAQGFAALFDRLARVHLCRDVSEVAHHAVATVGERNAVEAPLVVLGDAAIDAELGALGREERFSGLERVPEDPHHLVGVVLLPQNADDLLEVAAHDAAGDGAEDGQGDWIDLADAEIRVDHVDADRRLIEQRLELCPLLAQLALGVAPHAHEGETRLDARQQLTRTEGLDQVVVGPGVESFDPRLLASTRRQQDHRQLASARIGAQLAQQTEAVQFAASSRR